MITLDWETQLRVHHGEITPAEAFALQASQDAAASAMRPPCTGSLAQAQYLAAAAWIDASADAALREQLAIERDAIEPRRAAAEGGDGTLSGCTVARWRADIVRAATAAGWDGTALDLVIPLGTGSQADDAELRYLLRSALANLGGLRRIHIMGPRRPAWLTEHPQIHWHDWTQQQPKNHDIVAKLVHAAQHVDVSEYFVCACDDWAFVRPSKPLAEWGAIQRGGVLSTLADASAWKAAQAQTRALLEAAGKPVLFYDTHTPSVMSKAGWARVDREIPWRSVSGHAVWSLYHNTVGTHGPILTDAGKTTGWHSDAAPPQSAAEIDAARGDSLFVAFNTACFNDAARQWLQSRFPTPAPWEAAAPSDPLDVSNLSDPQPARPILSVPSVSSVPSVPSIPSPSLPPPVPAAPVTEFAIRIPWRTDANIGRFYNDEMAAAPERGWVLFLDHDVMVLTPRWYNVCLQAINEHPDAGLFTCRTNRGKHGVQRDGVGMRLDEDIAKHLMRAAELAPLGAQTIPPSRPGGWGFFMLVSKAMWRRAPFTEGFNHVDTRFFRTAAASGMPILLLDGVYAYHAGLTNGGNGRAVSAAIADRSAAAWAAVQAADRVAGYPPEVRA